MQNSEASACRPTLRVAATCAAPAVLVALAVLLPSLDKAFTIDDVTFLLQAQHVLVDPLHPTAFEMVFHGVRLRLARELVSGPVMAYLLVPSVLLGGAEWAAHAIQATLLAMSAVFTGSLALRLGLGRTQATIASLLVVVSPAVLGMAATAMPDVPAMAFAVAGMERLVAWRQDRRPGAAIAAASFLALAVLSRPHVLLVLACAAVWLTEQESRRSPRRHWWSAVRANALMPVALALALIGIVLYVTRDPASGDTIASATLRRVQPQDVLFNLASFSLHWAVAFPLALLWPVIRGKRFWRFPRMPIAFNTGMVLVWSGGHLTRNDGWPSLALLLLGGLTLAVLVDILADAGERRDKTQMMLGMWLLIGAAAAAYTQLPAKVLVPSAPAMAILIARQAHCTALKPLHARLVGAAAVVSLVLGILIIRADAALAEVGRRGGQIVAEEARQGGRVWMDGGWSYQWYAMAAGAHPLAETPPFPQPGDVVVAGLESRLVRRDYKNKTLLRRVAFARPGGRVHGKGAGFFTNRAGPWPWRWGREELGRIEVWRIDPLPGAPE